MADLLVIDDDAALLEAMRQILERGGHRVRVAANGRQGCRAFLEQPAEVVITDILMPEQEGLETITQLRRLQSDLPIVAISGGGAAMSAELTLSLAHHLGVGWVLAKPFTRDQLLQSVALALAAGAHPAAPASAGTRRTSSPC